MYFSFLDGHACDSFYANQIQAIPLEQFLSVHSLIDEQGTQKFSELELSETGLQASQQTIAVTPEILVGVSLSEKQQSDHGTFIDFEKEQWVIQQRINLVYAAIR